MKRVLLSPLVDELCARQPGPATQIAPGTHSPAADGNRNQRGAQAGGIRLFAPLHYEPGYAYPLLVWLHSSGDDPRQLLRVMPEISLRNYVAVAPQAREGDLAGGFLWRQTPDGIDAACRDVAAAVDQARARMNVAVDRIWLAGLGGGGTMAFRVAFRLHEIFAGVLSFNGALPDGQAPLGQWRGCRRLPVFWAHQRHSIELGEERLCRQLKLLHIAGFDVQLRQYPGGDGLPCSTTWADANRWMMGQIPGVIA
jgi:phospholipase/carboxylesterase